MFGVPFHPAKILRTLFRNQISKRFELLSQQIQKLNADVLLLQEVHLYPSLHQLRKLLSQYGFVIYEKGIYGPKGGLVIFSKLPVEKADYADFAKRGSLRNKSISGIIMRNGLLLAKVRGTKLWLMNAHLTQNSDCDWSVNNRYIPLLLSQLRQCQRVVDLLKKSGQHLIAAGDFNMPKDSIYYYEFIQATSLNDAFSQESSSTYHQDFLLPGQSVGRIDYIYYTEDSLLRLVNHDQVITEPIVDEHGQQMYLTDHIGLKGEFVLYA